MDKNLININFVVEKALKREIERQAERENRTLSNLLRHVLREYLRQQKSVMSLTEKVELLVQKTEKLLKQQA